MESTIYHPEQLLWFIVFHLCVDVHSCFAIFMSGKILNRLWINSRIEKIGDVSVPQLVRGHIKVQRIFDFRLIFLCHAQRWGKIDIPVAVIFSKFDAIEPIIPKGCAILNNSPHCKEKAFVLSDWHNVNSEVQGLLRTWGAESFLAQLDVNYTDFSCFAVSSLGLNNYPTADLRIKRPRLHRIEDPLLWILMKLKVIKSKK